MHHGQKGFYWSFIWGVYCPNMPRTLKAQLNAPKALGYLPSFNFHASNGPQHFVSAELKPKQAKAGKDNLAIDLQLIQPLVAPLAALY